MNRANDLKDIPIFGVEKDVSGFYFVLLIPGIGWTHNQDGIGYGIKHGHIGKYKTGDSHNTVIIKRGDTIDLTDIYFGNISRGIYSQGFHEPLNANSMRTREKVYRFMLYGGKQCLSRIFIYKNKVQYCQYTENDKFLPVELSFGISWGARVGFSIGEIFDFLVGFIGFDPMDDDLAGAIPVYLELPQPTLQNENWESKVDALDERINSRGKK